MYRILVVDDEAFITDGLARLLEEERGLELDVYKAYSAIEAMEFLNKASVDIVITDIQMPCMTGLELLKEIHERWPSSRVIFLTGFNEFEYAYQAMQYKAVRYILKSESDDVILSAVKDCILAIDGESKNEKLLVQAEEQMKLCLPVMRREFLQKAINRAPLSADSLAAEFERLEIGLDPSTSVLLLAARLDSQTGGQLNEAAMAVDMVVREKLGHAAVCEMGQPDPSCMLWLIQPAERGSFERAAVTVKGMAENIQRTCLQSLGASVSFVFDGRPVLWADLPERCAVLRYIVQYRLEKQAEMAFADCAFFLRAEGEAPRPIAGESELKKLLDKMPLLEISLDRGDRKEFNALLEDTVRSLKRFGDTAGFRGLEALQSLNLIFVSYVNKHNLESFAQNDPDLREIGSTPIGFDRLDCYYRIGNQLMDCWQAEQKDRGGAFVESVNRYIYDHLNGDLSLVALSEKVYLNPSYLSRRYKEETGKNISDVIAETRFARAKKLLSDNRYKIGDIAGMVGYESPAHFSRIFKRAAGMSPQEYRDGLSARL